jgi:hypothetical protein
MSVSEPYIDEVHTQTVVDATLNEVGCESVLHAGVQVLIL